MRVSYSIFACFPLHLENDKLFYSIIFWPHFCLSYNLFYSFLSVFLLFVYIIRPNLFCQGNYPDLGVVVLLGEQSLPVGAVYRVRNKGRIVMDERVVGLF